MSARWWDRPFRLLQTNLREIDTAVLDVDATVAALEAAGADAWLLNTGGIVANHPTSLASQRRNPGLAARPGGDLIGEAVAAAHARDIRLLARMDFSKVDPALADAHPDWCYIGPEGERQVYIDLVSVCPSGPYLQAELFRVLDEVVERYPVDGFFFNMWAFNEVDYSRVYRGPCHCVACVAGFAAFAPGVPLPAGPASPGYAAWQRYTVAVLDDLSRRAREHIAAIAPAAAYVQGTNADIAFHEANDAVGRRLWSHHVTDDVSALRSLEPAKPSVVHAVLFLDMPYRFVGEDPDHYAQYLVQGFARGANPSVYLMGPLADARYEALGVARELTALHRAHDAVYRGLRQAAPTLLVRRRPLLDPDPQGGARAEYEGVHAMLVGGHVPFDVADLESLDRLDGREGRGRLEDRAVVVLPDLGALPPGVVDRLDAFVAAGGLLVTTGSTALDGGPAPRGWPVARVDAVYRTEQALLSRHLELDAEGTGDPVAAFGALWEAEPAPGATVDLPMIGPAPFGPPERCFGHRPTGYAGAVQASAGVGRILVLPWTVGRVYRGSGARRLRDRFVGLLAGATGALVALPGTVPEQLEVVLGRSEAGEVAHLLNRSGDRDGRFAPPVALPPGEVVLPWPGVRRVRAALAGHDLAVEAVPAGVRVGTPEVARFEILIGTP